MARRAGGARSRAARRCLLWCLEFVALRVLQRAGTDQAMPGMTGVELAAAVQEKRPGLPILLVTGYADLPASKLSRWPRLAKPFQQAQLQAAIDVLLKRDDTLKKEVEVERLRMALRDNVVTQEVRTNGFGAVDMGRLDTAITQIGLTHNWKAKPRPVDIFDSSFLPPLTERRPS